MPESPEKSAFRAFLALVKEMRKAQKDYFAGRAPSSLKKAKKLEKDVDSFIKCWKEPDSPQQLNLLM